MSCKSQIEKFYICGQISSSMLIRLTSLESIRQIINKRKLEPTSQEWGEYKAGSAIFLFECIDIQTILNRYGPTCAQCHSLKIGDFLYIIEILNDEIYSRLVKDRSQFGWPESRVLIGDIPINSIIVKGKCQVIKNTVNIDCLGKILSFYNPVQLISLSQENVIKI